jgi:hypothetical protein
VTKLQGLAVRNSDTVAATVTVYQDDGSNERIIVRATLAVGDTLMLADDGTWQVIDSTGHLKRTISAATLSTATALLTIGTVADGEFLARSGTTIDGRTLSEVLDAIGSAARGDLLQRGAATWARLALGTTHKAVMSDGTDALWKYPGMVLLATATASASATIEFALTSPANADFAAYLVVLAHVAPATDSVNFLLRTSTDGGATYSSGAGTYAWTSACKSAIYFDSESASATSIALTGNASGVSNVTNEHLGGTVTILNPVAAQYGSAHFAGYYWESSGALVVATAAGQRLSAGDVDGIQFLFSSGNVASGIFKLYGIPA